MNKILVEVLLPAADKRFDVFLPVNMLLHDAVNLVGKMLSELSGGTFLAGEDTVMCDAATGTIYNRNLSVSQAGLENGTTVLLV